MAKNSAFKPVLLIGVVALIVGGEFSYSAWKNAHANDRIPWRHDLEAGEAEAKQSGKKVFAYFTASWCGPCQQLKTTTWADDGVAEKLKGYIPVKLDVDEKRELAMKFGVQSIPTFFVLTDTGDVLQQSSGFMDAGQFLRWLK